MGKKEILKHYGFEEWFSGNESIEEIIYDLKDNECEYEGNLKNFELNCRITDCINELRKLQNI